MDFMFSTHSTAKLFLKILGKGKNSVSSKTLCPPPPFPSLPACALPPAWTPGLSSGAGEGHSAEHNKGFMFKHVPIILKPVLTVIGLY
jgi:hypothetical protein